ncbi:uncharacterized protein LOC114254379 isoform X2 [Monomorium pharaonis]|uniref:uncharacterized protein LOC114254379 isoform X2 n=1 Tax=Monomorium pharaonis TaxID=307658 RepID=UPI001747C586|nr:uncharacterized protein LOC114254379 isoform X2 [Monomorium pharaonis]
MLFFQVFKDSPIGHGSDFSHKERRVVLRRDGNEMKLLQEQMLQLQHQINQLLQQQQQMIQPFYSSSSRTSSINSSRKLMLAIFKDLHCKRRKQ